MLQKVFLGESKIYLKAVCVISLLSVLMTISVEAQEETPAWRKSSEEVLISLQISKQSIETFVSMLAKAGNTTIIMGKGIDNRQVSAFYQDTPFSVALNTFAAAQELCVVERDNCILLLTRREYMNLYAETEIISLKNANAKAIMDIIIGKTNNESLLEVSADIRKRRLILKGTPEQILIAKKTVEELDSSLISKMYIIKYASVTSMGKSIMEALDISEQSLGSVIVDERSNRLLVYETSDNHEICRKIINDLDVPVDTRVFSTGKIDPKIIAEQIRKGELGGATDKEGKKQRSNTETNVQVIEGTNQIIVTDTSERLKILEGVMAELNRNIQTEIIRPHYAMPSEISDILSTSFPDAVITVDARTNSLVITAHRDHIDRIKEIIKQLDAEANVEVDIEAKIMLVASNKLKEYGTRIFGQDLDGFNETLLNLTSNPNFLADSVKDDGSSLGNAANSTISDVIKTSGNYLEAIQPNIQINALVRALESDGDTKILSNPKMRTLVGKSASIFSGSKEPYKEISFQNDQSQENVEFIDIGITFNVTPLISPDNILTLEVMTEFSSLREIRDGIPVVDTRTAESTVESKDGDTIFLGGLINEEETYSRGGVPILKSIPILGYLFGEKKTGSISRELVIVIIPKIVDKSKDYLTLDQAISRDYEGVLKGFGEGDTDNAEPVE